MKYVTLADCQQIVKSHIRVLRMPDWSTYLLFRTNRRAWWLNDWSKL